MFKAITAEYVIVGIIKALPLLLDTLNNNEQITGNETL
jgi:hypothetical protein